MLTVAHRSSTALIAAPNGAVGWKNILGVVQTLDLERKSKNSWVAKVPQGYEAEANVAESFLHTLSGMFHQALSSELTAGPKMIKPAMASTATRAMIKPYSTRP